MWKKIKEINSLHFDDACMCVYVCMVSRHYAYTEVTDRY